MKRFNIAFICFALTVSASLFTACAFQISDSPDQESSPIFTSSLADPLESAGVKMESQTDEAEYLETAYRLLEALDDIDRIGGSGISMDPDTSFLNENGDEYRKVLDKRFSNTADLRDYIERNLTDNLIKKRYSGILDTDSPRYQEIDGELYGKYAPIGCGFPWKEDAPKISGVSEKGFTIVAEYDNYGAVDSMTIHAVRDGEQWKIDSLDF